MLTAAENASRTDTGGGIPHKKGYYKKTVSNTDQSNWKLSPIKKKKGEIIITQSRNGEKYGRSEI